MAFPARHGPDPAASTRTERVEALLRERKLDRTLTTTLPALGADRVAAFGLAPLDAEIRGVPRGQVSELIGPVSSGRTTLAWTWLGAATQRGESVALIDTFDRFDPASGAACGIVLSRLLWVRGQAMTKTHAAVDPAWLPGARAVEGPGTLLERTIDRALKAVHLVLQSGVCTAVVLDVVDLPPSGLRRVPHTTWLRMQRSVEGTDVACVLVGSAPLARSAGGITIHTGSHTGRTERPGAIGAGAPRVPSDAAAPSATGASGAGAGAPGPRWVGGHHRSRRLGGMRLALRVSSPRRVVSGQAVLDTVTRHDAWARE